nr:PREDICTED: uncharacterized protein LOC107398966 [Tribolium castaneum]XP_015840041.1 PREDICTED: uncharacterized protein LOC107398966 [Tribolium castaneum]XP_015840042.1 PREDICTED: uncharacterized protein LOC107398966 [Tribolium castaneum]|eukprot:XP_015840040.1 PREDICTED: uncharacterized protein LOC107398966 [Tribolium castaneum]
MFFTNEVYDKSCLVNPEQILSALQNPVFKLYFTFLSYILDVVNTMNLEFQGESPKLHLLHSRITGLFKSILKNFMKPQYLSNLTMYNKIQFLPHNYKTLDNIYCGANCELIINSTPINKTEIDSFKIKCLDFYVELSKQILSRFNFDDNVLKFMQNFDPAVAVSGVCETLVPLASRFPTLVTNLEKLNSEWRLLSDMSEIKMNSSKSLVDFWNYVFNIKNGLNEYMFPHLTNFVKGLLCLPHSSAAAERIFSQLSLIKTKNRNKLNIFTCNYLLHTKYLLKDKCCFNFEPLKSLMSRNLALDSDSQMVCDSDEITF